MSDVKWFKILTDIFSDDKIKIVQSMPDGDALLVMWFKILAQAGKTNDGGYIYLKKNMPYTPGMLSTLFNKSQQTVELALRTFTEFDMIDIDEHGYIFVTNWEKHQSIEKMEKIREQTKNRVKAHREKKKLELGTVSVTNGVTSNVTCNADVTQGNATDIEVDIDKEKDTTTTGETISDIHTKVFNTFSMTGLMSELVRRIKDQGYDDDFIKEVMLETGESASKPSIRLMETIATRWMGAGITSRQQAREEKEGMNRGKYQRFAEGNRSGGAKTESEFAFLDFQTRTGTDA